MQSCTSIAQADRNWSQSLGEVPARAATAEVTEPHGQRAIDEQHEVVEPGDAATTEREGVDEDLDLAAFLRT